MFSKRKFWSPFVLFFLLTGWSETSQAKRFVVVVGPHETNTHTTSFLSEYAANDGSGAPSFDGWSWPIIQSEEIYTSPKHVFDLLVQEPDNNSVQDIIIDGIRSAWNESENGVFIGSLDFDKVGTNPFSGYDAVASLVKVVDEVGVSPEDVTVIVTYRSPRVEQWAAVWKNHFDAASYEDFVCSDLQSQKRWEWLDTSMNPFKLAKAYHDEGWNVGVVDQGSILKAGKDVAHTIACLAMDDVNCVDDWVLGLKRITPDPLPVEEVDLSSEDGNDLEKLFLFRDCYYVTQLDRSPRFGVFAEDSGFEMIHSECSESKMASYARLARTEFLMNAIQFQKSCPKYDVDIPSILEEMSVVEESNQEPVEFDGVLDNDSQGPTESETDGVTAGYAPDDDEAAAGIVHSDPMNGEGDDEAEVSDPLDSQVGDEEAESDPVDTEAAADIVHSDPMNGEGDDEAEVSDPLDSQVRDEEAESDPVDTEADDEAMDSQIFYDDNDEETLVGDQLDNEVDSIVSGSDLIKDETDDEVGDSGAFTDERDDETSGSDPPDIEVDGDNYVESNAASQSSIDFKKKLVVFVGPHETDAIDVTKFFVNYASANEEYEPVESFNGWSWPLIEDDLIKKPAHHIFDYLVTDADKEDIQTAVLGGIVDAWTKSERGVIIGSLSFDAVGDNPYSGYNAKDAIIRVEEALEMDYDDITIVVTYRSPRIDHWSAVWSKHFGTDDYDDFICSDDELSDKRWEWLDNVMNPFKIAMEYYDKGYNVAVVDQESAINAGKDTSHIIACYLMEGVNCKNDLVVGLENAVSDPEVPITMDTMTEDDRRDLEELFRDRDCHFKYELKDKDRFVILNQRSAWSTCSEQHKAYYEQFTDTDFLLEVLQSQKQCGQRNINVSEMLEKKMVQDDGKKLIVFAGPHETAAIPVTKFFAEHASVEDDSSSNDSTNLGGWAWPTVGSEILGDIESHRTFDLLFRDADSRPVQNLIMDGIRDSWNEAEKGIIIGSLDFDRVGKNPYTGFDALGAVDRVVETLDISSSDVNIVLNYRSKRIDHLSAVWWNHFDTRTFENFVCSDNQADKRWEWIDTVMNPLKLASAYIEEGWNVTVIEHEGTSFAGKDVSHSLACHLMNGVDCDGDWIRGLRSETTIAPNTYEIPGLDNIQRSRLEILFLMRDCFYKSKLESDNKFSTINKKELWESCPLKDKYKYEKLVETDFVLAVMQSLQGCGDGDSSDATAFATELLKLRPSSHSTLIIATLFISFVCVISLLLKMKERRKKKLHEAHVFPPAGVFMDDPTSIGRGAPYSDGVLSVEDMDQNKSDSDEESGENENGEALTENFHDEEGGGDGRADDAEDSAGISHYLNNWMGS